MTLAWAGRSKLRFVLLTSTRKKRLVLGRSTQKSGQPRRLTSGDWSGARSFIHARNAFSASFWTLARRRFETLDRGLILALSDSAKLSVFICRNWLTESRFDSARVTDLRGTVALVDT